MTHREEGRRCSVLLSCRTGQIPVGHGKGGHMCMMARRRRAAQVARTYGLEHRWRAGFCKRPVSDLIPPRPRRRVRGEGGRRTLRDVARHASSRQRRVLDLTRPRSAPVCLEMASGAWRQRRRRSSVGRTAFSRRGPQLACARTVCIPGQGRPVTTALSHLQPPHRARLADDEPVPEAVEDIYLH